MEQDKTIYSNIYYSSPSLWSIFPKREAAQESYGLERVPSYVYIDIHGAEIAELRERIKKLEDQLGQRIEREVVPINFLITDELKLKKSFNAVLEYYPQDNLYIVDCPELNIYGEGRDRTEALDDFRLALEETYFSLKEDKDKLGPELEKEWKFLNQIIEEK